MNRSNRSLSLDTASVESLSTTSSCRNNMLSIEMILRDEDQLIIRQACTNTFSISYSLENCDSSSESAVIASLDKQIYFHHA